MEERHLSLSEVAGLMDVSERTVRRWIKSGKLKAYKPGRDYRIMESDFRQFIEESEVAPKVQWRLPFEEERSKDVYLPWLDFVNRYAGRWEEKLARGDLDIGSLNEFLATFGDLSLTLKALNTKEQREIGEQEQYASFGAPGAKTGVAMWRLLDLLDPLIAACAEKDAGSELEQLRRKKAELVTESREADTNRAADG